MNYDEYITSLKRNRRADCLLYEEFDRKYNVNTSHPVELTASGEYAPGFIENDTEGNVGYQNTTISSIETMNSYFSAVPKIRDYTFLDVGCGKGRVILASLAQNAPYGAYRGFEAEETLWSIAQDNIRNTNIEIDKPIEIILADAREFICNSDPTVYFFFEPFSKEVFDQFMQNNWEIISNSPHFLVFHILQHFDVEKYTKSKPVFNDNFITIYSS